MLSRALDRRRSGVLLHPTSLPGPGPNAPLGGEAYRFVDFLAEAGFGVWQTLPLNPRDNVGSPYRSSSVFAMDTALLAVEPLEEEGLLAPGAAVTDAVVARLREPAHRPAREAFEAFAREQAGWLEDYALYDTLRREYGCPWHEWPAPLRDRKPSVLAAARDRHAAELQRVRLAQFLCDRQWRALRRYANDHGVLLFGDVSFFVAHDSADVWAHRALFRLDRQGRKAANTGVPPDYFTAAGQLWDMPHYNWEQMAASGWRWWIGRLRRQLELFDLLRLDHFRGLAAAWQVPAAATDAVDGHWEPGPGLAFLQAAETALGELPLVAEDLGHITPDVERLRGEAGMPGMRVLQFAFDGDAGNPHLPHNYDAETVAYTGTHDNNTLAGWWETECDSETRRRVEAYLGPRGEPVGEALARLALASVARLAVLPMQDVLGLGSGARLNTPGTQAGNWTWRLDAIPDDRDLQRRYREMNAVYGRL